MQNLREVLIITTEKFVAPSAGKEWLFYTGLAPSRSTHVAPFLQPVLKLRILAQTCEI
jgi:hypothetical protein